MNIREDTEKLPSEEAVARAEEFRDQLSYFLGSQEHAADGALCVPYDLLPREILSPWPELR